jgi:hypothetical protein
MNITVMHRKNPAFPGKMKLYMIIYGGKPGYSSMKFNAKSINFKPAGKP